MSRVDIGLRRRVWFGGVFDSSKVVVGILVKYVWVCFLEEK